MMFDSWAIGGGLVSLFLVLVTLVKRNGQKDVKNLIRLNFGDLLSWKDRVFGLLVIFYVVMASASDQMPSHLSLVLFCTALTVFFEAVRAQTCSGFFLLAMALHYAFLKQDQDIPYMVVFLVILILYIMISLYALWEYPFRNFTIKKSN